MTSATGLGLILSLLMSMLLWMGGGALPARVYADPVEMALPQLLQLDPFENEVSLLSFHAFLPSFLQLLLILLSSRLRCFYRKSGSYALPLFSGSMMVNAGGSFPARPAIELHHCMDHSTDALILDVQLHRRKKRMWYCISLFAHDDKAEAEFTMFDKVGKAAVGKPLLTLLKSRNPGYSTIQEIARIPMVDRIAPPEVVWLIGQKYKLLVSIASKSFNVNSEQLSFQVVRIIETYKPELSSSAFDHVPGTSGALASTSLTGSLVPSQMFTPSTPNIYQTQPGSSSSSLTIGYKTPTADGHTPTSKLSAGLLPTTALGKSPCPTGSARRALFIGTDHKTTALDESLKNPDEADKGKHDDTTEPSSPIVEEKNDKDDQAQMTGHKRGATAGKGDGKAKKTK